MFQTIDQAKAESNDRTDLLVARVGILLLALALIGGVVLIVI